MNMFEKIFSGKKEGPKKVEGPSFEELIQVLSTEEQEEVKRLRNIEDECAVSEEEDGKFEIDYEVLSEAQKRLLDRYYALITKARNIAEQK